VKGKEGEGKEEKGGEEEGLCHGCLGERRP